MTNTDHRVALVTGGSRGIGAAIAERLAEEGADVALTYRTRRADAAAVVGRIASAGRQGLAIRADSADSGAVVAAVEETVARFGRLDVLVNNAGVFPAGPIESVGAEEVDEALHVHARAAFVASQAASRHMRGGGRIISIGSCLAERVPYPGVALYAMSKSALSGMTKGLARDLGDRGITVNLVHPGSTDTEMNPADAPEAESELAHIALQRYGLPGEVAATVAHLAGAGGRYVTGAAISVDGGFSA